MTKQQLGILSMYYFKETQGLQLTIDYLVMVIFAKQILIVFGESLNLKQPIKKNKTIPA